MTGTVTPASNVIFTESQCLWPSLWSISRTCHVGTQLNSEEKLKILLIFITMMFCDLLGTKDLVQLIFCQVPKSPDAELDSYLVLTYETSLLHQRKSLPSAIQHTIPYPNEGFRHFTLAYWHFLQKSIDSHLKGEILNGYSDSISLSCEEVTCSCLFTYDQVDEPCTYIEAISSPHSLQRRAAMREEIEAIKTSETGTLVAR